MQPWRQLLDNFEILTFEGNFCLSSNKLNNFHYPTKTKPDDADIPTETNITAAVAEQKSEEETEIAAVEQESEEGSATKLDNIAIPALDSGATIFSILCGVFIQYFVYLHFLKQAGKIIGFFLSV